MMRILVCLAYLLLISCQRYDYITWHCNNSPELADQKPITMILDKAEMKIAGITYVFCGSLGNASFFSQSCPTDNSKSEINFIKKTGELNWLGKSLYCVPL